MVDLYSSDAVKGTVEEYMPAFGKCVLKRQIVLAITASLYAPVTYGFWIALGELLFLGSLSH